MRGQEKHEPLVGRDVRFFSDIDFTGQREAAVFFVEADRKSHVA